MLFALFVLTCCIVLGQIMALPVARDGAKSVSDDFPFINGVLINSTPQQHWTNEEEHASFIDGLRITTENESGADDSSTKGVEEFQNRGTEKSDSLGDGVPFFGGLRRRSERTPRPFVVNSEEEQLPFINGKLNSSSKPPLENDANESSTEKLTKSGDLKKESSLPDDEFPFINGLLLNESSEESAENDAISASTENISEPSGRRVKRNPSSDEYPFINGVLLPNHFPFFNEPKNSSEESLENNVQSTEEVRESTSHKVKRNPQSDDEYPFIDGLRRAHEPFKYPIHINSPDDLRDSTGRFEQIGEHRALNDFLYRDIPVGASIRVERSPSNDHFPFIDGRPRTQKPIHISSEEENREFFMGLKNNPTKKRLYIDEKSTNNETPSSELSKLDGRRLKVGISRQYDDSPKQW